MRDLKRNIDKELNKNKIIQESQVSINLIKKNHIAKDIKNLNLG